MFVYSFCKISLTPVTQKATVDGFIVKLNSIRNVMQNNQIRCEIINLFLTELWMYLLTEFHSGVVALDKVAQSLKDCETYFQIVYSGIIGIRNYFSDIVALPESVIFSDLYSKVEELYSLRRLTGRELINTYYLKQLQHQFSANQSGVRYGTVKFLSYFMEEKESVIFELIRYENMNLQKIEHEFRLRLTFRPVPEFLFPNFTEEHLMSRSYPPGTTTISSPFGNRKFSVKIHDEKSDLLSCGMFFFSLDLMQMNTGSGSTNLDVFLGSFFVPFRDCEVISELSQMLDVMPGSLNVVHTGKTLKLHKTKTMTFLQK